MDLLLFRIIRIKDTVAVSKQNPCALNPQGWDSVKLVRWSSTFSILPMMTLYLPDIEQNIGLFVVSYSFTFMFHDPSRCFSRLHIYVSWPCRFVPRPHIYVPHPSRFASWPYIYVSCPCSFVSWPYIYVSCPSRFVSRPYICVSCPSRFVSWPYIYVSCHFRFVSRPYIYVSCSSRFVADLKGVSHYSVWKKCYVWYIIKRSDIHTKKTCKILNCVYT